jgi:hypothetical protein
VTLRFNPGSFAAGIPLVPPVLETIFDLNCPSDDEVGVVISPQSGQSFYRTTDPIFNQRFRARLFTFQANSAGQYMIMLSNVSGFSPFITASRNFATSWQVAGDTLVFNVAADQTGPITVEVTTEFPMTYGEFDIHLQCEMGILVYWNMDETGPGPFFTGPDRVDSVQGIILGVISTSIPSQTPGKLGSCALFQFHGSNTELLTPQQTEMAWSGEDITIAFWVLFQSQDVQNAEHVVFQYEISDDVPPFLFPTLRGHITVIYNPFLDRLFLQVYNIVGQTFYTLIDPVNIGQWYFIQIIYDATTGVPSFRIDNGSIVDGVFARPFPVSSSDRGLVRIRPTGGLFIPSGTVYLVDEIGIWMKGLDITQLDDLWNSGNGVTWPDVPM